MSENSASWTYCGIHGGFYPAGQSCPNCGPQVVITPAVLTYGYCTRHGNAYAGAPCAECAAERQRAEDIDTRFSTHHALWQAARHDIDLLRAAEDRQDAALTDLEAGAADLNALYDRVARAGAPDQGVEAHRSSR